MCEPEAHSPTSPVWLFERSCFDVKTNEDGQVLPLTTLLLVMILFAGAYGLGLVHGVLQDEERAQTAADAAALAGAIGGDPAARSAAEANGGHLVTLTRSKDDTTVTVRVGSSQAKARAHQGRLE